MILEIVCIYKKGDKQLFVDIKKNGVLYQHLAVRNVIEFILKSTNVSCVNFSIVDNSYFRGKNCKLRMEVLGNEQTRLDERKLHESDREGCRRVERRIASEKESRRVECSRRRGYDSEVNRTSTREPYSNKTSRTSDDVLTSSITFDNNGVPVLSQCSPKKFSQRFADAHPKIPFSPCVDKPEESDLKDRCCLYTEGVGFVSIEKDGNICAVLKDSPSTVNGFSKTAMINALRHNGSKLDCFAIDSSGSLVDMYMKSGFIPVCRIKFNPEYAPDKCDYNWGMPDVVFMMHNLDTADEVAKKYGTYGSYKEYLKKIWRRFSTLYRRL